MAAGELVALLHLALLSHIHANELIHLGWQVIVFAVEAQHADDAATGSVGNAQRRVAYLMSLRTEDGAQQALLRRGLRLTLRRDLAHQDVTGEDLGTDTDDAVGV